MSYLIESLKGFMQAIDLLPGILVAVARVMKKAASGNNTMRTISFNHFKIHK